MSFRRALLAGARALSTAPQTGGATTVAQTVTQSSSAAPWVEGMPTRAIADALLSKENYLAPHDALYDEVNQTGVLRSHRHFKHCLKMLKEQNRVRVICLGPEKVASNKRKFSVKLTSRGRSTYSFFKSCYKENAEEPKDAEGLKDALP